MSPQGLQVGPADARGGAEGPGPGTGLGFGPDPAGVAFGQAPAPRIIYQAVVAPRGARPPGATQQMGAAAAPATPAPAPAVRTFAVPFRQEALVARPLAPRP